VNINESERLAHDLGDAKYTKPANQHDLTSTIRLIKDTKAKEILSRARVQVGVMIGWSSSLKTCGAGHSSSPSPVTAEATAWFQKMKMGLDSSHEKPSSG
jgi:hypothetical protein